MKTNTNEIVVNIWDDYDEDGSDEKQESNVQVEDSSLTLADKKLVLDQVLPKLQELLPKKVKLNLRLWDKKYWIIDIEDMTHKMRETLMEQLDDQKHNLFYKNRPICFISES